MSMLADLLNERGISKEELVARSRALESHTLEERAVTIRRADARRNKKPYAELKLDKPKALGRGVSPGLVGRALAGQKIPRVTRKKILRAVNSILVSKKSAAVEVRQVFGDVGSRKGKSKVKGKK